MKNDYVKVDKSQQLRGDQSTGIEGSWDSKDFVKSNLTLCMQVLSETVHKKASCVHAHHICWVLKFGFKLKYK